MSFKCVIVDYNNEQQAQDLIRLLNAYALDPMGGETPLKDEVKMHLISRLASLPTAITILCYDKTRAVGLLNAFEGFSTFSAAPLFNVHDVYIAPNFRGQGILEKMFSVLEDTARNKGCCKITLEVLSNNETAKAAYQKLGFDAYQLKDEAGHAVFWQKPVK